jgi:hypothetical protein
MSGWLGPCSQSSPCSPGGTQASICRACDNVAAHIADVSGGSIHVLRMVLFFAVDEANRVWLTHAGSLKTQRRRPMAPPAFAERWSSRPPLLLRPSGEGANTLGLELPAPSAAFAASHAAAPSGPHEGGRHEPPAPPAGPFLCVLTGEMCAGEQRCEVTYKQLLQHWFSLASQLPSEGDRLRAMDAIPLAIRRANPSISREWYLRVRSQPSFLYRTAPICAASAGQLSCVAMEELQRTVRPHTSGAAPGGGVRGVTDSLLPAHRNGARPTSSALPGRAGAAPTSGRAQLMVSISRGGPARAQSASPAAASRLAVERPSRSPPLNGSASGRAAGGSGAAAVLQRRQEAGAMPSMLLPREAGEPPRQPLLLSAYGPTPQQAAEAAAVAAALPYAVLAAEGVAPLDEALEAALRAPSTTQQAQLQQQHAHAAQDGGLGYGGLPAAGPDLGWAAAGGGRSSFRRSQVMRASTSSDATEQGSVADEPGSPNDPPLAGPPPPPAAATSPVPQAHGSPSGARASPPRAAPPSTLHTIHEEGGAAARPEAPLSESDSRRSEGVRAPLPPRAGGAAAGPRLRSGRSGTERAAGSSRRQNPQAAYTPLSGSAAVAHRSLSESGDFGYGSGGGGGSLNSTMASSAGSMTSRRSTSTMLTNEDARTLRELNDAYRDAERLTQQLLAQVRALGLRHSGGPAVAACLPGARHAHVLGAWHACVLGARHA